MAACTWLLEEPRDGDANHPRFCLVWDNADDIVTLDHLFQLQLLHHRGVQIITTRIPPSAFSFPADHACHDWPPKALKIVRVGPYTEAEAREHLRQVSAAGESNGLGAPPPAHHDRILRAAQIDGVAGQIDPLKLHDTLAALQKRGWKLEAVLGQESIPSSTATSAPVPPQRTHAEVLAQTLAGLSPLTRLVWRILVHLAPAPIPESFWSAMDVAVRDPEAFSEEDQAAIATELRGRLPTVQARAALAEAGLLSGGDAGDVVHIRHHALGREATTVTERPAVYHVVVRLLRYAAPSGDPINDLDTWPFYQLAEPHFLAALGVERSEAIVGLWETGWLTDRCNKYLLRQSRLVEAQAIAQLNLQSNLAIDGEGSESHGASLHQLARVHVKQGLYAEAESGFQKALAIKIRHHGESHPATATTIHELARLHFEQGLYAEAESELQKALAIGVEHHRESHADTAVTIHELACLHFVQGLYTEAESEFQKALEIEGRRLGESHPNTATTIYMLALVQFEQGRYAEAEAGFQRALDVEVKTWGKNSWEAAVTRGSLARVAWATNQRALAEQLFRQAQVGLEAVPFRKGHFLAQLLHNWAACEVGPIPTTDAAAPPEDVMTRIRRALDIRTSALGDRHPYTAQARLLLAECLRRQGSLPEARAEAKAAAEVLAAALPKDHRANVEAKALLKLLRSRRKQGD